MVFAKINNKMEEKEAIKVVVINGIEYLTFPQALDYLESNREKIRQRVLRGAIEGVEKIGKYLFIPMSYLEQEKKKELDKETEIKMDELKGMGLTKEDLERFIAMKKQEQSKTKKK